MSNEPKTIVLFDSLTDRDRVLVLSWVHELGLPVCAVWRDGDSTMWMKLSKLSPGHELETVTMLTPHEYAETFPITLGPRAGISSHSGS
jgi:hypothetical protein